MIRRFGIMSQSIVILGVRSSYKYKSSPATNVSKYNFSVLLCHVFLAWGLDDNVEG